MKSLQVISGDDLDTYPLTVEDRLDSHYFMAWERRRWLNSDMRLRGTPECRALFFDLINIAYDQVEYGPLHKWRLVRCGDELRLAHPMVLRSLQEAIARREDNRAKNDAANIAKRLQRLRITLLAYNKDIGGNDAAVRWIDEWLVGEGCEYRSSSWIERGIARWMDHSFALTRKGTSRPLS